jgi:Dna[CI] antecedent, DciA
MGTHEEAAIAVQRALLDCVGPGAAEQLALAQARLAWSEVVEDAGLEREPLHSRLVTVAAGQGVVEASDPILAQELKMRADELARAMNARMAGRPGATIVVHGLAVSVHRGRD